MKEIHQFVDTFSEGDAIGNYTLQIRDFLRKSGFKSDIYMNTTAHPQSDIYHWSKLDKDSADYGLIFHHSTLTDFIEQLPMLKAKIMMIYHNITPAAFYKQYHFPLYKLFKEAERRNTLLEKVHFSGVIGDSKYNLDCIEKYVKGDYYKASFPPFLKIPVETNQPNTKLIEKLQNGAFTILYVARVAANKRHNDLLKLFEYYQKFVNPNSRLVITGYRSPYDMYFHKLEKFVSERYLQNVIFTGKVTHADLLAYYKTADIFISMSEHEGFCVPPIEAIYNKVPVLAYDIPAVKELLGSEYLFKTKDYVTISAIVEKIRTNKVFRKNMIDNQQKILKKFEEEKLKKDFNTILKHTFNL